MSQPKILITNDDGVNAVGIRHLWNALESIGERTVVAPAHEQSAMAMALTTRQPLQIAANCWPDVSQGGNLVYSVDGTTADCVKMALSLLLPQKPDLVISGINRGSNEGRNVLYSGTIGGAIEAVLQGIPGIAFSCRDFIHTRFESVEPFIAPIVRFVLDHPLPPGTLLNVNFPSSEQPVRGIKLSRQGRGYWMESPEERAHPHGSKYYWLGFKAAQFDEHPESDVQLLNEGYITAVPIHIDHLTDLSYLDLKKEFFGQLLQDKEPPLL